MAIGGKTVTNAASAAVVSTATLGYVEKFDLIEVADEDKAFGYETAFGFGKAGFDILIGVGTGGAAGALSKGGTVAKTAAVGLEAFDLTTNAVNLGRGIADVYNEGGLTWGNALQIGGSLLGMVGNRAALKQGMSGKAAAAGVDAPGGLQRVGTGGLRNEIPLTAAQQAEARAIALELGATDDMIRFSNNMNTSYGNLWGREVLYIGSDVLPAANPALGGMAANSRLTMRASLAHELYGHRPVILAGRGRAVDGQISAIANALEEAEASIRAARFAPGLSSTERYTLLRDAMGRLRNQGLTIRDVRGQLWIIEP